VRHGLATILVSAVLVSGCSGTSARQQGTEGTPSLRTIEVAVTVDDLPRFEDDPIETPLVIHRAFLDAFARHHVPPVYGFVNGRKLDDHPEDRAALVAWMAAGQRLGNHTYSHAAMTLPARYLADVDANERVLRSVAGERPSEIAQWKYFRYPSLVEGSDLETRAAIRKGLGDRGYRIVGVTIDLADWAYSAPYERCVAQGNASGVSSLTRTYLEKAVSALDASNRSARELVGRAIRHILVLHISRFGAHTIDPLLAALAKHGARFVSLDDALADRIYAEEPRLPVVTSGDLFTQIRASRGIKPSFAAKQFEPVETVCQ